MAKACGLEVSNASLIKDKNGNPGLLVERFDRVPTKVHQEDACQFLDRFPADKYRLSHAEIATGIQKRADAALLELAKYIRLIAFSYITGNGELHAKNISLRKNIETGRSEMTPAYDLLSTLPYGDRKMALKLDGKDEALTSKMFIAFGERYDVRPAVTVDLLKNLCDKAGVWIERIPEIGFDARRTADIQRTMTGRILEILPA